MRGNQISLDVFGLNGVGYELVYYRVQPGWINKIMNFSEDNIGDKSFQTISQSILEMGWKASIVTMIGQILNYMLLTGEYQEVNGEHWIDLSDFNDWFSMVQDVTGIRGVRLPKLEFKETEMTWDELFENLKETS